MSLLYRIVYAAHANGTHHKLALDALQHMGRADAEAWRRVFLKHVGKYLEGSKAPDNVFKDFKNHVLHVGDEYWGGAPEKVEEWYGKTIIALRAAAWEDAAYAAGVLSHYYTDPVMPFHTGQTEAENAIHRGCEWSINRSYDALRADAEVRFADLEAMPANGANWLKEFVCDGAEFSHRYYEKLIAHYDITRGATSPTDGLDSVGRSIVAELLMYAAEGFGNLLDRAISEAGVAAPEVSLTVETVVATLQIPSKWIEKKLGNAEDRRVVQAMYDELKATGKVEKSLPEDDRSIRDLYAAEVLAPKDASRGKARTKRIAASPAPSAGTSEPSNDDAALARAVAASSNLKASGVLPPALPDAAPPVTAAEPIVPKAVERPAPPPLPRLQAAPPQRLEPQPVQAAPSDTDLAAAAPAPAPAAAAPQAPPLHHLDAEPARPAAVEPRKRYLSKTDDLEAAPSIGPKMAQLFAGLGIKTVGDFLGQDPHDMAELLDDSRFDAETLTDWQDQAQLVIDIPGLRGTHAQLLVGAGYRTAEAIADATPVDLSADVLKFAATSDGKRILRDGNTPDIEKIKSWVESAREALAA